METEVRTQTDASKKGLEPQNDLKTAPDWTESEWFEVWLKLARREHEPTKN